MSDAKKCDRCDEYFGGMSSSRQYKLKRDILRNSTTPSVHYKTMDLCSDCYSSLEVWVEAES